MPKSDLLERIQSKAKDKEKKYDWLSAVEFYKKALAQVLKQKDFVKAGEIQERIGHCFHRTAFQAKSQEEFKQRLERSIEAYEEAHTVYGKLVDERKGARIFRCRAFVKYLAYWLTSDPSEKRKLLDECLELEGKALAFLLESGDMLEYGRTYNELPLVFLCRGFLEWNRETLKSIVERGLEWGEKAVAALSEIDNLYEVAKAYFTLGTCLSFGEYCFIAELEDKEKKRLKAVEYLSKAVDISEKLGDAFLL